MAYSDYGAFVWKNGKLIKDNYTVDTAYVYIKDKGWICTDDLSDDEYEASIIMDKEKNRAINIAEGHAMIKLTDDLCLSFYKTYGLQVHNRLKKRYYTIEEVKNKAKLKYNRHLSFDGYPLDFNNESIWRYDIRYRNDNYCVIVGSSFGAGYEERHISKLILKLLQYGARRNNESYHYYLQYKDKDYYPIDEMIEYAIRQDDIDFEKYLMRKFNTKPLIKAILTFNFRDIVWFYRERREKRLKIKYLK